MPADSGDAAPPPRRQTRSEAGSTPEPEPEPENQDSGVLVGEEDAGDGADAATDPSCEGKPNGFTIVDAGAANRCCSGKAVDLRTKANCGGCGIQCPTGMACEQPVAGQWGCRCVSDLSCQNAGYGTGATCYDPGNGKAFCNCQCATNDSTCTDRCAGGATCNDKSGQNYCHYPDAG